MDGAALAVQCLVFSCRRCRPIADDDGMALSGRLAECISRAPDLKPCVIRLRTARGGCAVACIALEPRLSLSEPGFDEGRRRQRRVSCRCRHAAKCTWQPWSAVLACAKLVRNHAVSLLGVFCALTLASSQVCVRERRGTGSGDGRSVEWAVRIDRP